MCQDTFQKIEHRFFVSSTDEYGSFGSHIQFTYTNMLFAGKGSSSMLWCHAKYSHPTTDAPNCSKINPPKYSLKKELFHEVAETICSGIEFASIPYFVSASLPHPIVFTKIKTSTIYLFVCFGSKSEEFLIHKHLRSFISEQHRAAWSETLSHYLSFD